MSRLGQGRVTGKLAHGELGRQHAYAQPTRLLDATAVLRELLAWGAFRERFVASLAPEHARALAFVERAKQLAAVSADGARQERALELSLEELLLNTTSALTNLSYYTEG